MLAGCGGFNADLRSRALTEAARTLRDLPAARILESIADAAARWSNADFPARARATREVMARTGYSEPVVDYALDRLFEPITREALQATIVSELGSLEALDGFVARAGRPDVFFHGAGTVTIVSSDTTIGVALAPLVFALCAKCAVTVKDRSDHLIAAFAQTLIEERAEFATSLSVANWSGPDDARGLERLTESDVVVAFGGPHALAEIRSRLRPDARFVPFGHRTSAGYVTRETLSGEDVHACAAGAARDALLYDGEGCLSLHALFVERGGRVTPERFGEILFDALDAAAIEFPAARSGPDSTAAVYRNAARFRASQGQGELRGGIDRAHLLVLDAPHNLAPPFVSRTLALYTVDGPHEALAYLRVHGVPLEAFATCGAERPDVLAAALESGAARIARLGALQAPSLAGEHGGVGRILPFVRAISRDR